MTSVAAGEATTTVLEMINFLEEHLFDVDEGQEKEDTITSYSLRVAKTIDKLSYDMPDATAAMKLL